MNKKISLSFLTAFAIRLDKSSKLFIIRFIIFLIKSSRIIVYIVTTVIQVYAGSMPRPNHFSKIMRLLFGLNKQRSGNSLIKSSYLLIHCSLQAYTTTLLAFL